MSKNHIWVVECKVGRFWLPFCNDVAYDRGTARLYAQGRRLSGYETRVVKYVKGAK